SGPPSFAATMIARDSFEKSFPRFASAAPFLCLIDDHLLCPDMRPFLDEFEKALVHARVVRQLRVKRRDEEAALAEQHRLAVELGEDLDVGADVAHARRADEDAAQGLVWRAQASGKARRPLFVAVVGFAVAATRRVELEVGLEARDLAPVPV